MHLWHVTSSIFVYVTEGITCYIAFIILCLTSPGCVLKPQTSIVRSAPPINHLLSGSITTPPHPCKSLLSCLLAPRNSSNRFFLLNLASILFQGSSLLNCSRLTASEFHLARRFSNARTSNLPETSDQLYLIAKTQASSTASFVVLNRFALEKSNLLFQNNRRLFHRPPHHLFRLVGAFWT